MTSTDDNRPPYQLPENARGWYDLVLSQPGLYGVTGASQTGKTALLDHLCDDLFARGFAVIAVAFGGPYETDCSVAIAEIYDQLRSLREDIGPLLPDQAARISWDLLDTLSRSGGSIALLVDNTDGLPPEEIPHLDLLLPDEPPRYARVVVVSSEPLHEPPMILPCFQPPRCLTMGPLSLEDVQLLVGRYAIADAAIVAGEIFRRTGGRPSVVAELCRRLRAHPADIVLTTDQLARHDLSAMEQLVRRHGDRRPGLPDLFRRLICALAVSPAPLPFPDLESLLRCTWDELDELCRLLGDYLTERPDDAYSLDSQYVADLLRRMPQMRGRYAAPMLDALRSFPAWCLDQYDADASPLLTQTPTYVLKACAAILMDAEDAASFRGERIFADRRWRDALEACDGSTQVVRDAVQHALLAAQKVAALEVRALAATACAAMMTSLVAVRPPELVALLVQHGHLSRIKAEQYAHGYPTRSERENLRRLLDFPAEPLPRYESLAQQLVALHIMPSQDRAKRLRALLLPYDTIGVAKREMVVDALGGAVTPAEPAAAGRELPFVIANLKSFSIHNERFGLLGGVQDQLSDEQQDLLVELALTWPSNDPRGADHFMRVVRLVSTTRANLFEALTILAPAIIRAFGPACARRMAQVITAITDAHP